MKLKTAACGAPHLSDSTDIYRISDRSSGIKSSDQKNLVGPTWHLF